MYTEKMIRLNNGVDIPQLAMGTWLIENDIATEAVATAIELGYRHIDTAQAYENEAGVADGIRKSGVDRKEIFVTSKVAAEIKTYEGAKKSIDETLERMGFDYVDMMLIHCPQPWAEYNKTDNRYFEGNRAVWRAMEEAVAEGKVRTIGVSNFIKEDIDNILEVCSIRPAVNQVHAHIFNIPTKVIDYCSELGIETEAYSPIAHGNALNNPLIKSMAERYRVTPAQLCIKYCLQLGLITLPKATGREHLQNNMELDFEISAEDMTSLEKES